MNKDKLPFREEYQHEELDSLIDRRFPDIKCPYCDSILGVMTLRNQDGGIILSLWCTNDDCAWRLVEEEYRELLEGLDE